MHLRRILSLTLLALAVAAALALSACGGDSGGENAQQTLKQTFSGQKKMNSGKLNLSFSAELKAKSQAAAQLRTP